METKIADSVSSLEALETYEHGGHLTCPSCGQALVTIPENLPPGNRPLGLQCPISKQHYLIYGDDAETMRTAREGLRRIAVQSEQDKAAKN